MFKSQTCAERRAVMTDRAFSQYGWRQKTFVHVLFLIAIQLSVRLALAAVFVAELLRAKKRKY